MYSGDIKTYFKIFRFL